MAIAGDTLEIRDKQLYLNDKPVPKQAFAVYKEDRIIPGKFSTRDNLRKIIIPDNKLFVMGDNRDNSHDSRFWGFVDLSEIKGEAFMIYWSWNKNDFGVRWKRLGNLLI